MQIHYPLLTRKMIVGKNVFPWISFNIFRIFLHLFIHSFAPFSIWTFCEWINMNGIDTEWMESCSSSSRLLHYHFHPPFNFSFSFFYGLFNFYIHNKIFVWRKRKVRVKNNRTRRKVKESIENTTEIKLPGCRVLLLLLLLLRSVFHRYAFKYLFCIILFMLKFPFFFASFSVFFVT